MSRSSLRAHHRPCTLSELTFIPSKLLQPATVALTLSTGLCLVSRPACRNLAARHTPRAKLLDSRTRLRSLPVVIGLGSDLIEIERIERSFQRYGDAFLQRIFTPGEIAYCMAKRNFAESLAARFAAKEAGAKALGTGISRGVSWREFEVRRRPGQRPELHLSGRALEIANHLGVRHIALTLSHARTLSIAFVVAED